MRTVALTASTIENGYKLYARYIDYVLLGGRRIGEIVCPVILPYAGEPETIRAYAEAFDGYLFTGGGDVDPAYYGAARHPLCGEAEPGRDEFELALLRELIARDRPVFGICRGIQIMNVALGGSLYQDIAEQMSQTLRHPQYQKPAEKVHIVQVDQASALYRLTGMSELGVNSRHHQGIKRLGAGLSVSAVAPDGLVEGIELPEHPFAIGIQWHPETLSFTSPEAQALFDALKNAAEQYRSQNAARI